MEKNLPSSPSSPAKKENFAESQPEEGNAQLAPSDIQEARDMAIKALTSMTLAFRQERKSVKSLD